MIGKISGYRAINYGAEPQTDIDKEKIPGNRLNSVQDSGGCLPRGSTAEYNHSDLLKRLTRVTSTACLFTKPGEKPATLKFEGPQFEEQINE